MPVASGLRGRPRRGTRSSLQEWPAARRHACALRPERIVAGYISQNVYLFCASEGLATGVRASIDRPALAKELKLRPDQKIILAHSVGYPKK